MRSLRSAIVGAGIVALVALSGCTSAAPATTPSASAPNGPSGTVAELEGEGFLVQREENEVNATKGGAFLTAKAADGRLQVAVTTLCGETS